METIPNIHLTDLEQERNLNTPTEQACKFKIQLSKASPQEPEFAAKQANVGVHVADHAGMPSVGALRGILHNDMDVRQAQAERAERYVRRSAMMVMLEKEIATGGAIPFDPDFIDSLNAREAAIDEDLIRTAIERLSHLDPSTLVSDEELYAELGLAEEDLEGWDDVEFE